MPRRAATLASALTVATAALVGAAQPASAQDFCNVTTGGPFNGTTLCVRYGPVISSYIPVPYSVGSICVGSVCTTPVSGTVNAPVPNLDPADVYGQVCVPYKSWSICVPFSTNLPIASA